MSDCRCIGVLCACADRWEFLRQLVGWTPEQLDQRLGPIRESHRRLEQALEGRHSR